VTPEVVDQSGSRIDPQWFADQGGQVIAVYCGKQSWKVPPASYIQAVHKAKGPKAPHGLGVAWFWEDSATNALKGAVQGKADGATAKSQMDAIVAAVGYAPKNIVQINAAVDFDTNPAQYPPIDAYLRAYDLQTGPRFNGGDYGEADLLDHVHDAGIMSDGYGTYAWSHGRVSVHAVMQQTLNGQVLHGAQVDFGNLINAAAAGIWWPPGHPLDAPIGDDMSAADVAAINKYADDIRKDTQDDLKRLAAHALDRDRDSRKLRTKQQPRDDLDAGQHQQLPKRQAEQRKSQNHKNNTHRFETKALSNSCNQEHSGEEDGDAHILVSGSPRLGTLFGDFCRVLIQSKELLVLGIVIIGHEDRTGGSRRIIQRVELLPGSKSDKILRPKATLKYFDQFCIARGFGGKPSVERHDVVEAVLSRQRQSLLRPHGGSRSKSVLLGRQSLPPGRLISTPRRKNGYSGKDHRL